MYFCSTLLLNSEMRVQCVWTCIQRNPQGIVPLIQIVPCLSLLVPYLYQRNYRLPIVLFTEKMDFFEVYFTIHSCRLQKMHHRDPSPQYFTIINWAIHVSRSSRLEDVCLSKWFVVLKTSIFVISWNNTFIAKFKTTYPVFSPTLSEG